MSEAHDKAVLVGIKEERDGHSRYSWVSGSILRLDGRSNRAHTVSVEAGCHTVEVEVEYAITLAVADPCFGLKEFHLCERGATFESGRRHFALLTKPGLRYELSARITEEGIWVYFVEVHPELGTVARFTPVSPATTVCRPGIAL
jgi:hypothetical protein